MDMVFLRKMFMVVVGLLFCSAVLAQAKPATELSQQLRKHHTYQANFHQTTYTNSKQRSESSTGRVYMKRPGKFRWEVETPLKQIIIANGSTMWIYDASLQQATKQRIKKNN